MTVQRERRYISEYMLQAFPGGAFGLNVELGPVPADLVEIHGAQGAKMIFRPFRRRVDGVAWDSASYWLVESKIRDPLEGLGRLQTYRDLAEHTPDLVGYEGQKLRMRLVVPFSLDWIKLAAQKAGIELVEFMPAWIYGYFNERQKYFTAEYRVARDEKVRMRQLLGLD